MANKRGQNLPASFATSPDEDTLAEKCRLLENALLALEASYQSSQEDDHAQARLREIAFASYHVFVGFGEDLTGGR